jgi:gliding motility-associated-like protein
MNKKLLRYFTLCCLSFLGLFLSFDSRANHWAAADMSVRYVGTGYDPCTGKIDYTYEVKLKLYIACENISSTIGRQHTINWASAEGGLSGNFPVVQDVEDTLDKLCPGVKNNCEEASSIHRGYKTRTFRGNITLAGPQRDWRFWWTNSLRNFGINNLAGAATGLNIYIEAGINNATRYDVSTPDFSNTDEDARSALPYLCNGVLNSYVTNPFDHDNKGDSISTTLRPALSTGPNNIIAYSAPYSAQDPVGSAAVGVPFVMNTLTGTATFRAPTEGSFVLAFRSDKYEKGSGIRLGYSMRDVQVRVYNCTSPPPDIDSNVTTITDGTFVGPPGNKMVYVCPGSNLKFDIASKSSNTASAIYMRPITDIASEFPGSTLNVTGAGTGSITGTFSWTPGPTDIGTRKLIILSIDSTCVGDQQILLETKSTYTINVVSGLDAGEDRKFCQLNNDTLQLFVRNAENLKVNWSDIEGSTATIINPESISPKVAPYNSTNYVVSTTDLAGTCKNKDTVLMEIDEANKVEIFPGTNPYVVCRPDYVQLEAKFTGAPPLNNLECGIVNTVDCANPDSLDLFGSLSYGRGTSLTDVGASAPTFPNEVRTMKQQFLIRKRDLWDYDFRASTLKSLSFEVTNATVAYEYSDFTISMRCTPVDTLSTKNGFVAGFTSVFTSPVPIAFENGIYKFPFDKPYNWDTTQNLLVELSYKNNATTLDACTNPTGNAPVLRYVPTDYTATLFYKPEDNTTTDVTGVIKPTTGSLVSRQSRPWFRFSFCEAPPAPLTVKWTPTTYLSDPTFLQPLAYAPKSQRYVVETFGRNSCLLRDTIDIYVPVHNFSLIPADTTLCFGETAPLNIRNGFAYKWYEYKDGNYIRPTSLSCDNCANPIAKPKVTTEYRIVVYDHVWCADTLVGKITVLPLPATNIINRDTVIKYGSSIQLLASGAKLYNWMPAATFDNPNISNPIATPTQTMKYVLGGIGNNGCRSYDTITVAVDNREDLLIPTAFSPNGDGKNDRFRVANLSFQRLQEFRVFNRWGQEVFAATDNKGWDGTWKGRPQDVGTYQYVIRVAFPDGFVETYKGDVTLVK